MNKSTRGKKYGWRPDLPDQRDRVLSLKPHQLEALPAKTDLRLLCPPVYDQGALGSCTANALAGAIEVEQKKQQLPLFTPSRLFIYYNERVIEQSTATDSGAMLRDGMKTVWSLGACSETLWPYKEDQFAEQPAAACYAAGRAHRVIRYAHVPQTAGYMKACLAAGYPFVFGFTVYDSFESDAVAQTGAVPMPGGDESVLGGHAVLAVGYDDASQRFLARNSWGASWGMRGYFTIPYAYLASRDLSSDFWTIRLEE